MNHLQPLWTSAAPSALLASRHLISQEVFFPEVPAGSPLSDQFEAVVQPTVGELYSFTVIHPSQKSGLAPFVLAYLDLPGPLRLFGRLEGVERPFIGQRLRVVPDETFGFVFESVEVQP